MKYKKVIDGAEITIDDGDCQTDDIVELQGDLAEKADEQLVQFAVDVLRKRGWQCFPPNA